MSAIDKAIEFAVKSHAGQCRKGTKIPYIVHPLGVAKILIECGCPDHVVIAGILHDTVEDTPVTLDQIRKEFGRDTADLVDAASEPDKNDTWENRKRHTIGIIKTLSQEAALLVLADKLDNIRAIRDDLEKSGTALWVRFNRSREQQKWYYERLAAAFKDTMLDGCWHDLVELFHSEVARIFGNMHIDMDTQTSTNNPATAITEKDALNM